MSDRDEKPRRVNCRFFATAVLNETRSKLAGKPQYDDLELVEFLIPGDRLSKPVMLSSDRPNGAGQTFAEIYPEEYAAFKRGAQRATSGTPLEAWPYPLLTAARIAEMKAVNVFSVEDVAALSDTNVGQFGPGGRAMREAAIAYLETAREGVTASAAAAENAALKAQLARMQEQLDALAGGGGKEKALDDCSDAELRKFIKRESGSNPASNASRKKLLALASDLATKKAA